MSQHTQYSLHDIKRIDGKFDIPKNIREKITSEIKLCVYDKAYFLSKYITTVNPDSGRVPLILNRAQYKLTNNIETHRLNLCASSRGIGGTTLLAGLCLHDLLFKTHHVTLFVGNNGASTADFIHRVTAMLDDVPEILLADVESSKLQLRIGNNKLLSSSSRASSIGKGLSLSNIIMDNIFVRSSNKFNEILDSLIPCLLASKGRLFFLHTPCDNFFNIYRSLIQLKKINKFNITIDDVERFDDHDVRSRMEEVYDYWYDEYDYPWRFK